MKKVFSVFLMLLLACGTVAGAVAGTVAGTVDFSTLAGGTHARGITGRINEVLTDRASLDAFWDLVTAGTEPPQAAPVVDFTKDMAIAVSPGVMNTAGYAVEITKVTRDGTGLVVTVVVTRPTGIVAEVLTQPYHVITLARTSLPVTFNWEER
jgi:hypothetical protein